MEIQITIADKKVYWVSEQGEGIQYAVAAKNRNQAKLLSSLYLESDVPYIEINAKLARDDNKKPIYTSKVGEFEGSDYINHGMSWWNCPKCDGTNFVPGKFSDQYVCIVCGYHGDIPFAS